jgi:ferric enterobactin receptor
MDNLTILLHPATSQPDAARFRGTAKSKNTIHSFYSQFSGKSAMRFSIQQGYDMNMQNGKLNYRMIQIHIHLTLRTFFPSANLLYTFNNAWNIKAGYSKRIQRNNNFELNPIPEREHSETLEQGDPDLLPQFIDLAEDWHESYI